MGSLLMRSTSLQFCLKWPGNLFKVHRDGDRSLQLFSGRNILGCS